MNFQGHNIKTLVIKIGSNVLADEITLRADFFKKLACCVNALRDDGVRVLIVSSGASATAMSVLGKKQRPQSIPEKQAFAAIGQPLLMDQYLKVFQNVRLAQVLLTHDDVTNRRRFLNAKNTLAELLNRQVLPIINENDTVAVDEIKFGDNDRLSAAVAQLVEADLLLILSHVDGLYDADPHLNPNSQVIERVTHVDDSVRQYLFHGADPRSVGGMATKLMAAQSCMEFGIPVFITNGLKDDVFENLLKGKKIPGTYFEPSGTPLAARKIWIGHVLKEKGRLVIDDGARAALVDKGRSLLPAGVLKIEGDFHRGDCVGIYETSGKLVARGLVDYSCIEVEKIKNHQSSAIEKILGYSYSDVVVHRDNLVIL